MSAGEQKGCLHIIGIAILGGVGGLILGVTLLVNFLKFITG